eukprot:scaffold257077_cov21-Prasinocladus_malaysianus.AAC.2
MVQAAVAGHGEVDSVGELVPETDDGRPAEDRPDGQRVGHFLRRGELGVRPRPVHHPVVETLVVVLRQDGLERLQDAQP